MAVAVGAKPRTVGTRVSWDRRLWDADGAEWWRHDTYLPVEWIEDLLAQPDVPVAVMRSSSLEWIPETDRARVWREIRPYLERGADQLDVSVGGPPVYIGSEYRRLGERKLLLELAC